MVVVCKRGGNGGSPARLCCVNLRRESESKDHRRAILAMHDWGIDLTEDRAYYRWMALPEIRKM